MIYPKFLQENSLIGITSPSRGQGEKLEAFEKSLEHIKENNWRILETANVRAVGDVSGPPEERAKQFMDLMTDDSVDMIMCASGGDFLLDMLPYLEDHKIKDKWVMGYSDPTSLLYYITTKFDIATIYDHNAGSFDSTHLFDSQKMVFEYLKGNILPQESFNYHETNMESRVDGDYALTEKTEWKAVNGEVDITGRMIGGCLDCLQYLPGTKFDQTKKFVEKYKEDGFIWYFDVFALKTEDVYLSLFQLKEAGWFEHVKGVIVGRVLFPNSFSSMTYEEAFQKIFGDIPIIMEADIGHVVPKMTIINGAIAHVTCKEGKGRIEQYLK